MNKLSIKRLVQHFMYNNCQIICVCINKFTGTIYCNKFYAYEITAWRSDDIDEASATEQLTAEGASAS